MIYIEIAWRNGWICRFSAARLGQSINDTADFFRSILDVSMVDSNGVSVSSDRIEMSAVLSGLAAENIEAATRADVKLRVLRSKRIIRSDRVLLETTIQNLLSNAIRQAPGSRGLLGVRMRKGQLAVGIHDSGPGITSDVIPHIFEEFYRGSEDSTGAGLGLSIVQRVAGILSVDVKLKSC